MSVGRKEMGQTEQGKRDRDQQSLIHRHIAYPGSDGGPGVAGERSFVRRKVVAIPAQPLDLARPDGLEWLSWFVMGQGEQVPRHVPPRRKFRFGRLMFLLLC